MDTYITSEATKKLWAVELDLLAKFKEICEKHSLKYYAIAGTLLGAVRHKGFIPWDDDIDVALSWSDCQKLLGIAPKELEYPYFLQTHLTEKRGEISNFRLRRSDTTGFTMWEYNNVSDPNYNKGIFIDIFPLFYVPQDEKVRNKQKELVIEVWKAFRGYTALDGKANGLNNMNADYANYVDIYKKYSEKYTVQEIKELYFELCAMQKTPTEEVAVTSYRVNDPINTWKTAWFEKTVELPFENTTISAPCGYEEWLNWRYGDWHTPVYNGAAHEMYYFNADVPYTEIHK